MNRLHAAAVALAATLVIAGCGSSSSKSSPGAPNPNAPEKSPPGDIPDNQVYVAYRVPGGHVALKVPEGWAQTRSGSTVTFSDSTLSGNQAADKAGALPRDFTHFHTTSPLSRLL